MPNYQPIAVRFFQTVIVSFSLLILLTVVAPAWASSACDEAYLMPIHAMWRGEGVADDSRQMFRLDIPGPGLLNIEISVPAEAKSEPRIGRLPGGCNSGATPVLIEQTASRQMLVANEAGSYVFFVAAQDSRGSLGRYKLSVDFRSVGSDSALLFQSRFKSGEDEENAADEENEDEWELETDGAPFIFPEGPWDFGKSANLAIASPCESESDDYGDTLTCAKPIFVKGLVEGELNNDWGDDADVFQFLLPTLQTVSMTTLGHTDTVGVLFDRFGNRLAIDEDGGEAENFRIIKTLSPGTYYLRVEGSFGAEGPYSLVVKLHP